DNISFSSPISLGLEDQVIFDYKIYPNPTSNIINIQGDISDLKVIIYDMLGKVLMQSEEQESIDISFLKNGTYFLSLTNNSTNSTYKIIKK
ncbi:MAG TPA: T9SS type A sorting domain-containing protein, partial [Flavobacteriaceae bacterium]|nr:T9SS type A sorting domain-containing protein [Flavobacteriaceae bacterium]